MKKILITGANSYIGNSIKSYLAAYQAARKEERWQADSISLRDGKWEQTSFCGYDSILHLAGIAHADIGRVSREEKEAYYRVNRDLAVRAAEKARREGVKQFVYMSSVIVYGDSAPVGKRKNITGDTVPAPANFYGDSKYQAELKLRALQTEDFRIAVVRAPMIYGKGSKGNFPMLLRIAKKVPIFPDIENQRSMLYVENLAEFIRLLAEAGIGGTFFPQNKEYVSTGEMVRLMGGALGRRVRLCRWLNPAVRLAALMPGRAGGMAEKAFGSLTIDRELSEREITGYQLFSLEESIRRSI